MKRLLLTLPVILLAACASRTPRKIVVVPAFAPSSSVDEATVRRPEEVRQYRFGRYVDPGSRLVMHEAHPVYRIERTAGWNLRPDGSTKSTPALATAPVTSTSPDDAVVAEINKQKAATKAFTEQAVTLNLRLSGLTEAVTQTKKMAEQQLLQQRDIAALKSRLNAVETERAATPSNAASKTPAATEEKW
ncbi:MAG: hypothetical protein H7Y20_11640 [Bryobacteraceae bacterium]|nr:hypothetical protein [Bryobacteraceae bacterium]